MKLQNMLLFLFLFILYTVNLVSQIQFSLRICESLVTLEMTFGLSCTLEIVVPKNREVYSVEECFFTNGDHV